MSLLAIPLKVTGDVDLVKPIKTLISSLRTPSSGDTNSLTELQALRNKMVLNVKNKNYSDAAQRDIENYFDQIGKISENYDSTVTPKIIICYTQETWRAKYPSAK